jgi:signal transduction histidine kinase
LAQLGPEAAEVRTTLAAALEEVKGGLGELRALAPGIHPAVLTHGGLGAAIEYLAEQATVLELMPQGRYNGPSPTGSA